MRICGDGAQRIPGLDMGLVVGAVSRIGLVVYWHGAVSRQTQTEQ